MLSATLELQQPSRGYYAPHRQRARSVRPQQQPQQQQQHHPKCSSSCSSRQVLVRSLPRIADFIRHECPIRAIDGTFKEQPARPGADLQDSCVVQLHEESLLVPGQRQLLHVHQDQLEQIISDQGRAVLACLQNPTAATAAAPKLLSPARGSWSVAAMVGGVQRLPGSSRALVRLLVTDRVAVQALSQTSPNLVLTRSAQLRDRWCYFVRTAALDQHLGSSGGSNGSDGAAGRDVVNAVQQVQDAATELLQLLQQMSATVQQVVDTAAAGDDDSAAAAAAAVGGSSSLQQQLLQHEAAEELVELLSWCEMGQEAAAAAAAAVAGTAGADTSNHSNNNSSSSGVYGSDGLLPADQLLMERAWRVSFAPFAARGLAAALGVDFENGKSRSVSSSSSEVLEMMDMGLRLEAAFELGQALRQKLAARLSLEKLQS